MFTPRVAGKRRCGTETPGSPETASRTRDSRARFEKCSAGEFLKARQRPPSLTAVSTPGRLTPGAWRQVRPALTLIPAALTPIPAALTLIPAALTPIPAALTLIPAALTPIPAAVTTLSPGARP